MSNLICCDNICVEGNRAWFVSKEINALFQVNIDTNQCKCIVEFPDSKYPDFRRNPRNLKCGDNIFCFPDCGDVIWIYNLKNKYINYIEINNPSKSRISIRDFWREGEAIYAVSYGLEEIIEINIEQQKIMNCYKIFQNEKSIWKDSYKEKNKIYILLENRICEFDVVTKSWKKYNIPEINVELNTILYEEGNFWLTGKTKEIYVWNKNNNRLKILKDFPEQFGQYNFQKEPVKLVDYEIEEFQFQVFLRGLNSKKYIWFIPYRSNQILYVDKSTYDINVLEIGEEIENRISLSRIVPAKYQVLYYSMDGVLRLYSHKNNSWLEIDTDTLLWQYRKIEISIKEVYGLLKKYNGLMQESEYSILDILSLSDTKGTEKDIGENVGKRIYKIFKL